MKRLKRINLWLKGYRIRAVRRGGRWGWVCMKGYKQIYPPAQMRHSCTKKEVLKALEALA